MVTRGEGDADSLGEELVLGEALEDSSPLGLARAVVGKAEWDASPEVARGDTEPVSVPVLPSVGALDKLGELDAEPVPTAEVARGDTLEELDTVPVPGAENDAEGVEEAELLPGAEVARGEAVGAGDKESLSCTNEARDDSEGDVDTVPLPCAEVAKGEAE